ncbi:hypothetical protein V1477_010338 [Vespula maculifrons]|uniref:Uncharacterized protein n=1 Tax=Vespula maculifrons TaxID=7453 RepID=A0ABD2C891_VESMC
MWILQEIVFPGKWLKRTANAFLDDLKGQYKNDIEIEIQAQVIYQVIEKSNFLNQYKYLFFRAEYCRDRDYNQKFMFGSKIGAYCTKVIH